MNDDIGKWKNDLEALTRRVLALETQGIPLPDGGLATLVDQQKKLAEKIGKLNAALLCVAETLEENRKAQVHRTLR